MTEELRMISSTANKTDIASSRAIPTSRDRLCKLGALSLYSSSVLIDSFVANQTLVFQIKFCGNSPHLRVAAKRFTQF
jgi:hypothetical protein